MSQRPTRCASRVLRLAAIAFAALLAAGPRSACAQNPIEEFFNGLFGGNRHYYERQASPPRERREDYRARRYMPHSASRPQSISRSYSPQSGHFPRTSHPSAGEPASKAAEKSPGTETFFVAVMGDSLSQLLAQGLEDAFDETPQIGFRRKSKESSGLVRDDYFDWVKAARAIAAEQPKPDVAVMMIGANDHQPLTVGSESIEPLSPRWRELYAARVEAVAAAFKEKEIPFILVGLPVMKAERFSADLEQINEIERNEASKAGVAFVDIWDKFCDERGQYSAFGPDVNGEIVKLRSADGVHFTEAGARKLAHFLEAEIRRIYDSREETPPAPPAANDAPPPAQPPTPAHITYRPPGQEPPLAAPTLPEERPAIGPVQQLTTPTLSGDDLISKGNLAKRAGADASLERALATHVFIEGGDQPSRHGRADDFSFPGKPSSTPAVQ